MLLEHMLKKFEINRTKIKGSCQSGRKVVPQDSKSDLPLVHILIALFDCTSVNRHYVFSIKEYILLFFPNLFPKCMYTFSKKIDTLVHKTTISKQNSFKPVQ